MDQQPDEFSGEGQPPRRDLQNPKSPQLKVTKDSHKIKKAAPPAPLPHRPVIIYEVSPKVHHIDDPSKFMGLVQQLTGPPGSTVTRPTPPSAANMAPPETERTRMSLEGNDSNITQMSSGYGLGVDQGILEPEPGSIGPGSSMFMLPVSDPSPFIRLNHHQLYPDYDMTTTDVIQRGSNYTMAPPPSSNPSSSSNAFIYDDQISFDYFDSLFNQRRKDDDDTQ